MKKQLLNSTLVLACLVFLTQAGFVFTDYCQVWQERYCCDVGTQDDNVWCPPLTETGQGWWCNSQYPAGGANDLVGSVHRSRTEDGYPHDFVFAWEDPGKCDYQKPVCGSQVGLCTYEPPTYYECTDYLEPLSEPDCDAPDP